MVRNPKWTREEVILLVYTYFNVKRDGFDNAKMKQHASYLSALLNALPIHPMDVRTRTFRNLDGIMIKLRNLEHLDTNGGTGMSHYSRLDKEVFEEYKNRRDVLYNEARCILRKYGTRISSLMTYE